MHRYMFICALTLGMFAFSVADATSQTIFVKYQGYVDLKHLVYYNTLPSSFVNGAWYDKKNEYMIVLLKHTYYGYCGLDKKTFNAFITSPSRGRYYNWNIKGRFDCRLGGLPSYVKNS